MTVTVRRGRHDRRDGRDPLRHRVVEVVSACLLGLATVGSAWCAYQASQWNERSAEEARISALDRVEGTRQHSLAATTVSYDTNVITAYADAVATEQTELAQLYRDTLVRPGVLPILDRWEAEIEEGRSPRNLLEDEAYLDELFGPYREADQRAEHHAELSVEAGRNAVDHLVTTVLLAVALFFAGVTNVFRGLVIKLTAVTCSGLVVAFAAARISELPVV